MICQLVSSHNPPPALPVPGNTMSSTILPHSRSKSSVGVERVEDEERKGLLAGIDASDNHDTTPRPTFSESWPSRGTAIVTIIFLITLVFGGIFALSFFYTTPKPAHPDLEFHGHALRSNGSHNFKRTVLMVSIDGLRWRQTFPGVSFHVETDYLIEGLITSTEVLPHIY